MRKKRTKFKKAAYREYTDNTFKEEVSHDPDLGIVGPVIKGYRGDRIQVHFKNLASRPYSLHVHGGIYRDKGNTDYTSKASEGRWKFNMSNKALVTQIQKNNK